MEIQTQTHSTQLHLKPSCSETVTFLILYAVWRRSRQKYIRCYNHLPAPFTSLSLCLSLSSRLIQPSHSEKPLSLEVSPGFFPDISIWKGWIFGNVRYFRFPKTRCSRNQERERRRRRKRRRRAAVLGIVLGAIAQRATVRAIGSSLSYKDETHRSLPFPTVRRESEVTSERERERERDLLSVRPNK